MKRFWKIFGITLATLVSVLLIVICTAVYIVFTPNRLTPIVRNVTSKYLSCQHEIGDVELTFFSTFPKFGLSVDGLYLINPMDEAQSDTLLAAPKLVATIDLMQFIKNNTLQVHELLLDDIQANIYINQRGENNFDVFVLSPDTTQNDTSAFSLPFDALKVDGVRIKANTLSFKSDKDTIEAQIYNTVVSASAQGFDDISAKLDAEQIFAALKGEQYANGLKLSLDAPHTSVELSPLSVKLNNTKLAINEFDLTLDGNAVIADTIQLNATADFKDWNIKELVKLLPQSISKQLKGIDIYSAKLSANANVNGIYTDSVLPIIDANVSLKDASVAYLEVFPYKLEDIKLNAEAHLDLNDTKNTNATIHSLYARTLETEVEATGKATELLDDLFADVNVKFNVNLPEFKQYLQTDSFQTDIKGKAQGKLHAAISLSDLQKLNLHKGNISGDVNLSNLSLLYDSMKVDSKSVAVDFQIPNPRPEKKTVNWINAKIKLNSGLNFSMNGNTNAKIEKTDLRLEASNVLSNNPIIYANLGLSSNSVIGAYTDSISANLLKPELTVYTEYNTKDTSAIPVVEAGLKIQDLKANYADINAHLTYTTFAANLIASRVDKSQPRLKILLGSQSLDASMADDAAVKTQKLSLALTAQKTAEAKENVLLQWNPQLSVDLQNGNAILKTFAEEIKIPDIKFNYNNRNFNIKESRVVIGNSDFKLSGDVHNIGKWLDKKGNLQGELNFTSDHTDVNQLMGLLSAKQGSEEQVVEQSEDQQSQQANNSTDEANPFLVPNDVDLILNTDIKEATVFDQTARNLGGRLYVKDGKLILEEMGFICNAAKLQLTALYRTPRRNHLYVGLDYHMTNINIQELVNMIPQIDTLMPMLKSFRGSGEFHLAAETYMNANYDLKMSTTRGACSITGNDLVLLDGETFTKIAKILMFNKKSENKIDSLSVQATLYKNEIDIYPFCLTMDRYMAAAGGRHNTDMSFDYHISLLKPLYIGVDVNGTFDDLKIKPAKCKYAQDFRPIIRKDVETQNASLKKMIDTALKKNVKTEQDE